MTDDETQSSTLLRTHGNVGVVEPHDYVSSEPFVFESGQSIPGFTLRYETYGTLNAERDNAILICHALSGDHHCAGVHSPTDRKPGWWNNLIGPGKPVDTNRFFVLCANVIGGCQGSTGPLSIDPATGTPYGTRFPFVTIRDMVRTQKRWLEGIGVPSIHAIIGGSMGGMLALQWAVEFPDSVKRVVVMATTARESAQGIAFNEVGRQAIMQDPAWNRGDYPGNGGPRVGLAIARMMAHITYLSDAGLDRKFGRRRRHRHTPHVPLAQAPQETNKPASEPGDTVASSQEASTSPDFEFEIESYLRHQGQSFINRFDANSYLYITRAIDHFDLAPGDLTLEQAFAPVKAETLVIGFTSDWLFPPEQNREIALALLRAGKKAHYAELNTDLGHDSFLLESPQLYNLVRSFLE
ncbi:MAG: homoserine O-acetyltransferase [Opitutaceae bacterium]|nr:homoserine O-acetyltransferase [Opitutaceae bacterium]